MYEGICSQEWTKPFLKILNIELEVTLLHISNQIDLYSKTNEPGCSSVKICMRHRKSTRYETVTMLK